MTASAPVLFTIGHSNHPIEHFLELLRAHGIEVLADVRSAPYSRYAQQFNAEPLKAAIAAAGLQYVYLGRELGGRPEGDEFYDDADHVRYDLVAQADFFVAGIARLETGMGGYRVAIMCSEEDPSGCHRRLLVARVLTERGVDVRHIRADGSVQSEQELRDAEAAVTNGQLSLFNEEETDEWKSIRPVSRRSRPSNSSSS